MRLLHSLLSVLSALLLSVRAVYAQDIAPEDLIDAAIGDWNRDGRPDLAILASSDPDNALNGLHIYLREPDSEGGLLKLVLSMPDRVWGRSHAGGMAGQEPSIRALANGSLAVTERNTLISRDRWTATRAIAWRDGVFVVAGVTLESRDVLNEDATTKCDLNFLAGEGTVDGRWISFAVTAIPVKDWPENADDDPGLRICHPKWQ